jgi:hypothetical protein
MSLVASSVRAFFLPRGSRGLTWLVTLGSLKGMKRQGEREREREKEREINFSLIAQDLSPISTSFKFRD